MRVFHGYDESDPRPPGLRALDLARQLSSDYERVGIELSLGTQAADRMVGEPTTFPKAWFDAFPEAADATPLLARARAIKTEQEVARMRLANEIAAGAMEHVQELIRPGMRESEVGALWNGWVHDHGTGFEEGKVELAHGFSLVWSGPGIRTFTATGSREIQEHEPTLFEIWVCADGYWCDHTKNLVPGELDAALRRARAGVDGRLRRPRSTSPGRERVSPSSTGRSASGLAESATRGSRAIRSATASAPARTSRPTRTRPAVARSRPAWCWRSSPGCYWPEGGGLRVEDNFLITEVGAERLCRFPDGIVRAA